MPRPGSGNKTTGKESRIKMKLLLISNVDFPEGEAGSQHSALIARGLRENGARCHLIIPHGSVLGAYLKERKLKGHFDGVPYFYMNGKTTQSDGLLQYILESYRGMFATSKLIVGRLRKKQIDAVIIANPDAIEFLPVILTCMIFRVPIFLLIGERMTITKDRFSFRHKLRKLGFFLSETAVPRLANGIIVISSALEQYYRSRFPAIRTILSPILIDPGRREINRGTGGRKNDYFTLLYCGSFGEKDGIDYILRAFRKIILSGREARLTLVGRPPYQEIMDNLDCLIRKYQLQGHVELTGFVPRRKLQMLQENADILLACRTNSRYSNYGFPWKLGEYCLTAKPILATRTSDIERYFEDNVSLFIAQPENVDSIAERLTFIMDHYNEALKIGETSRKTAEVNFNYLTETRKILNFIKAGSNCHVADL